ncbi:MAG: carboxylesterase family protein [Parasphingorhabdus sp.]|uniref:carboxylesterase/lipase family protein n=1 Tax=Parasphingorhabdus sp. TaxID=2709688 RepID=UPI00329A44FE
MKLRTILLVGLGIATIFGLYFWLSSSDAQKLPAPESAEITRRTISQGDLIGYVHHENPAHIWKSIGFAAPPVGDLRWRAPRPAAAWTGVRASLEDAPWCVQIRRSLDEGTSADAIPLGNLMGQEDCLYLNIFAPAMDAATAAKTQLPVMMWIHGGSNFWGRAEQYDPSALAVQENVIVVVIQYRLGPLGWFAHDALEEAAETEWDKSANFGILDQIAALDWIADNIAPFGGDPANITIFGESAGGHNVATLLGSSAAAGKFHKAIIQSGSFDSISLADAKNTGRDASVTIAANMIDGEVTAPALRAASVKQLHAAYGADLHKRNWELPRIIEDDIVVSKNGLTSSFDSTETFNAVPIITGTNRDEMKLFLLGLDELVGSRLGMIPYVRDQDIYDAASEYPSRMWRVKAVDMPATQMVSAGHKEVFAYRFDWDDAGSILGTDFGDLMGAAHAMEIPFVMGSFRFFATADQWLFTDENEAERLDLSEAMMGYWGHFAYHGVPGRGGKDVRPDWRSWSIEAAKKNLLIFDSQSDGGIQFLASRESSKGVASALFKDPRLEDAALACRIYLSVQTSDEAWRNGNKLNCK